MDAKAEGWWSRGYLPHFDAANRIQHVTFHHADNLPKKALDRMAEEVTALPPNQRAVEQHHRVQAWLDAGHGCCLLREPWAVAYVHGNPVKAGLVAERGSSR